MKARTNRESATVAVARTKPIRAKRRKAKSKKKRPALRKLRPERKLRMKRKLRINRRKKLGQRKRVRREIRARRKRTRTRRSVSAKRTRKVRSATRYATAQPKPDYSHLTMPLWIGSQADGTTAPVRFDNTPTWVGQSAQQGSLVAPVFKELYPGFTDFYPEARDLDGTVRFHGAQVTSPSCFAAVIPSGRIWGVNGAVITPDNVLLEDVSLEFSIGHNFGIHPVFSRWEPYPVTYVPGTVVSLGFSDSQNYFHWLYDVLGRLQLLHMSGIQVDKYVINPRSRIFWDDVPTGGRPFQADSLQMLGINPDQIIETHEQFHLKADHVVVLSHTERRGYPKWASDFLRKVYLFDRGLDVNGPGTEYVYVSRLKATRRRILNETDVIDLLTAHGFKIYILEDMSLDEQIRLFNSAKVVVGPHGAGMANITFCRPGTSILEIFTPNWVKDCYWRISSHCGLDYHSLVGEGATWEGMRWEGEEDLIVNIDQLKQKLAQLPIYPS